MIHRIRKTIKEEKEFLFLIHLYVLFNYFEFHKFGNKGIEAKIIPERDPYKFEKRRIFSFSLLYDEDSERGGERDARDDAIEVM